MNFCFISPTELPHILIDRRQHHAPVLAVLECPDVHLMKSGIRVLDDFPCVNIPSNARDSNYQVKTFAYLPIFPLVKYIFNLISPHRLLVGKLWLQKLECNGVLPHLSG